MKKITGLHVLYLIVFLLSVAFRLSLATLNREANDNHITVIDFILLNQKLPKKDNCWECFQPKLFHSTVTTALTHLGLGKTTDDPDQRILIAQSINFVAGVLTLVIAWVFISGLQLQNERLKFFTFALVALNPPLIGISAQATNDAFVILFSTLTIYCASFLLKRPTILSLLLTITFAVLAVSSKTNGWVAVLAVFVALLVKVWSQAEGRWKLLAFAFTFLLSVALLATLNPLNQYVYNYQKYGSPFVINMERPALPLLFEKTYLPDGGILSVQDGFFTFHLVSLLEHPQLDYGNWNFTPQRTSFWTQLYAKTFSIHFENYPPSWGNSEEYVHLISRGILVLALLPTAILLIGFLMEIASFIKELFLEKFKRNAQDNFFGLFAIVFTAYLAFIILYALMYRDFTAIKAIFMFPALLSFIAIFVKGGQVFYSRFLSKRWGIRLFEVSISTLLFFYIADLTVLVIQLQHHLSIT